MLKVSRFLIQEEGEFRRSFSGDLGRGSSIPNLGMPAKRCVRELVHRDSVFKPLSWIYSLEVLYHENGGTDPSCEPLVHVDCDVPRYSGTADRQADDKYSAGPMSADERKRLTARIQAARKRAAFCEHQPVRSAADYFDPSDYNH